VKNLTAEIAEHAEVPMAKAKGPRCKGRYDLIFKDLTPFLLTEKVSEKSIFPIFLPGWTKLAF
jgi:hypothetical protein